MLCSCDHLLMSVLGRSNSKNILKWESLTQINMQQNLMPQRSLHLEAPYRSCEDLYNNYAHKLLSL